jgi:16S rRNA (uracil1498-N3)-methyltransferase
VRRFFAENIPGEGGLISLTGKEANHIRNVLRMKQGDTLTVTDGKGHLFKAMIEESHRKGVRAKIIKALPAPAPSPINIHLVQALIKSRPMDILIQKTTELGVGSITPFISERTAVKMRDEQLSRKMVHWEEIMKAACKQSGNSNLPALNPPLKFEALIGNDHPQGTLKLLLWEREKEADLKAILRTRGQLPHIMVVVGPEGGFTLREIRLARDAGFHIVSLGSRILRSETASITLISIIQYEWGDLSVTDMRSGSEEMRDV